MKKFITLLFSVGAFATSFAQYNHHQNNNGGQYANSTYGDRHDRSWGHSRESIFSARERDFQIARINHDFDLKVEAIQCDRYMRRREKRVAIRNAEFERSRQIQLVNDRFNCSR